VVDLLLELYEEDESMWGKLMTYVETKSSHSMEDDSAEYNELFLKVFNYASKMLKIDRQKGHEMFVQVWVLRPQSFSFSLFLHLLNIEYLSGEYGDDVLHSDKNEKVTIPFGIFQGNLLQLLRE